MALIYLFINISASFQAHGGSDRELANVGAPPSINEHLMSQKTTYQPGKQTGTSILPQASG